MPSFCAGSSAMKRQEPCVPVARHQGVRPGHQSTKATEDQSTTPAPQYPGSTWSRLGQFSNTTSCSSSCIPHCNRLMLCRGDERVTGDLCQCYRGGPNTLPQADAGLLRRRHGPASTLTPLCHLVLARKQATMSSPPSSRRLRRVAPGAILTRQLAASPFVARQS